MSKTKSPITGKVAKKAFVKGGVQYYTDELNNIFCNKLDQSGMVGGGNEDTRNTDEMNLVRMYRIQKLSGKQQPTILDYGCGSGLMVTYMQDAGIDCDGYDPYNGYYADVLSLKKEYDVIVLTEVIEHLTAPFAELQEIKYLCHPGSKVMIETSFTEWITQDDIYINPEVGHCTIFSHAGLDNLMEQFGFVPDNHINQNVRIYAVG